MKNMTHDNERAMANVSENTTKRENKKGIVNADISSYKIVSVGITTFSIMLVHSMAHLTVFDIQNTVLLSSYGATCFVLCLSPEAPIAQPRNVIGGHLVGASCGLVSYHVVEMLQAACNAGGITMIAEVDQMVNSFLPMVLPGSLAVSAASMLMLLSRTVHFPAGGTALGIAVTPGMPYYFLQQDVLINMEIVTLANVLFSSSSLVALACLFHRQSYPCLS
jgi:CBS-domain-containing membrane protein